MVDKPSGLTSHDVVARVRRISGTRRVGHTGTLDPMATGVLVLCLGQATRLIPYLEEGGGAFAKEYDAGIRFGFETTTDDAEGEPRSEPRPTEGITESAITAALRAFVGEQQQIPPSFSAKKVAGERAYAMARRGEEVALSPSKIHVATAQLLRLNGEIANVRFACSRGTYIRALARDLGRSLQVGAHLVALRRTRAGGLGAGSAVALDALTPQTLAAHLQPMLSILGGWPLVTVTEREAKDLRLGRTVTVGGLCPTEPRRVRVSDRESGLVALASMEGPRLRPVCVFSAAEPVVSSRVPNEDKSSSQNNKAGSEEQKET